MPCAVMGPILAATMPPVAAADASTAHLPGTFSATSADVPLTFSLSLSALCVCVQPLRSPASP